MPPISLVLDPFLYVWLYNVTKSAAEVIESDYKYRSLKEYEPNDDLTPYGPPILICHASVAEIRITHPNGLRFPKKGKRVSLSPSQAVALHYVFKRTMNEQKSIPVLQLYSMLDKALTDYNIRYGYRSN